jgi:hypothetical protein
MEGMRMRLVMRVVVRLRWEEEEQAGGTIGRLDE